MIEKLQTNADKVQKNIYDIEQNLNKVGSDWQLVALVTTTIRVKQSKNRSLRSVNAS